MGCYEFLTMKFEEMFTAASIWNPPREGGSGIPWNFEMWTNLEMVSSHCLVLEVWACLGLLLSLYVQWPHFIWGPSLLSCHLVVAGLSPLCPLLSLAQGQDRDPGGAFPHWLRSQGCKQSSHLERTRLWSKAKQSQASEPWWHYLYLWIQACFPICIWMAAQDEQASALCFFCFFFFLLVKQHILEMTPYQCMESTPIYSYNYAILHCVSVSIADSTTSLLMAIWGYFQSFTISNARAFMFSHSC